MGKIDCAMDSLANISGYDTVGWRPSSNFTVVFVNIAETICANIGPFRDDLNSASLHPGYTHIQHISGP